MPNKNDIQIKASVKERSLLKDLGKGAYEEIIVPKSKDVMREMFTGIINMIADAFKSAIDKGLYPDGNTPTRKNSIGVYTGNTSYTSFSRPISTYQPQKPRDAIGQRAGNEVKYIWVKTEDDAKYILGCLSEEIDNYGKAKVATLYEKCGIRTSFADFKYGWTNKDALGYYYDTNRRGEEDKWFLDLPRPIDITEV